MCDKAEKYLEQKLTEQQEQEILQAILKIEKNIDEEAQQCQVKNNQVLMNPDARSVVLKKYKKFTEYFQVFMEKAIEEKERAKKKKRSQSQECVGRVKGKKEVGFKVDKEGVKQVQKGKRQMSCEPNSKPPQTKSTDRKQFTPIEKSRQQKRVQYTPQEKTRNKNLYSKKHREIQQSMQSLKDLEDEINTLQSKELKQQQQQNKKLHEKIYGSGITQVKQFQTQTSKEKPPLLIKKQQTKIKIKHKRKQNFILNKRSKQTKRMSKSQNHTQNTDVSFESNTKNDSHKFSGFRSQKLKSQSKSKGKKRVKVKKHRHTRSKASDVSSSENVDVSRVSKNSSVSQNSKKSGLSRTSRNSQRKRNLSSDGSIGKVVKKQGKPLQVFMPEKLFSQSANLKLDSAVQSSIIKIRKKFNKKTGFQGKKPPIPKFGKQKSLNKTHRNLSQTSNGRLTARKRALSQGRETPFSQNAQNDPSPLENHSNHSNPSNVIPNPDTLLSPRQTQIAIQLQNLQNIQQSLNNLSIKERFQIRKQQLDQSLNEKQFKTMKTITKMRSNSMENQKVKVKIHSRSASLNKEDRQRIRNKISANPKFKNKIKIKRKSDKMTSFTEKGFIRLNHSKEDRKKLIKSSYNKNRQRKYHFQQKTTITIKRSQSSMEKQNQIKKQNSSASTIIMQQNRNSSQFSSSQSNTQPIKNKIQINTVRKNKKGFKRIIQHNSTKHKKLIQKFRSKSQGCQQQQQQGDDAQGSGQYKYQQLTKNKKDFILNLQQSRSKNRVYQQKRKQRSIDKRFAENNAKLTITNQQVGLTQKPIRKFKFSANFIDQVHSKYTSKKPPRCNQQPQPQKIHTQLLKNRLLQQITQNLMEVSIDMQKLRQQQKCV